MNSLFDALLNRPMAEVLIRLFLFILFSLHFLFVLFTIGTALQSVFYFVRYRWGQPSRRPDADQRRAGVSAAEGERLQGGEVSLPDESEGMPTSEPVPTAAVAPEEKEFAWGKQILHSFLGIKSMAVVLGVGALLLIELGLTVPFFTAIHLLAPYWLMIIGFLIIAFLTLDLIGQNWDIRPYMHLAMGIVGLVFLLAVPGIFVAAMATMERPESWQQIINNEYRLPAALSLHWLFRYGHVIGASLVFGGALHYFLSKENQHQKRAEMMRWIGAGILVQFALGILLYSTLAQRPNLLINLLIIVAIAAAGFLLWLITVRQSMSLRVAVPVLLLVLLPMLLTRQVLQDQGTLPVNAQAEKNAETYREVLAPYSEQGLKAYQRVLNSRYERGDQIYNRSCAFCHGHLADGAGSEAARLQVPPEVLAAVRADSDYLHEVLRSGVPGSGMPYFTYLTSDQMDRLYGYLHDQHQVLEKPAMPQVSQAAAEQAAAEYKNACVSCHGSDGRAGTLFSEGFAPPPPDFTRYSLTPERAFDVITNGYPGTLMASFRQLPEDVRWGLVEVVNDFRQ